MLPEKLRALFRRDRHAFPAGASPVAASPAPSPGVLSPRRTAAETGPITRHSRGMEQFFFNIRDHVGLTVLDFAGASQDNIMFLTSLGHRVYSEDLLRGIQDTFGPDPAGQLNVSQIDYFLRSHFDYPSGTFDGVLLWDSLQFMGPALLSATVDRLHEIMRPQSYLLAYFTANEKMTEVPSHMFRIADHKTVQITDRGMRHSGQVFNNRNIEKIFARFDSVKFFLSKENLREVIVRR